MNKYLLDTHTLIWVNLFPEKLSLHVKSILIDPSNTIYVSAVNFWELSIKHSLGKLELSKLNPSDFLKSSVQNGFQVLDINAELTSSFYKLKEDYHRDPFDRMLIWQALTEHLIIISVDQEFKKYESLGLKSIW